MIDEKFVEWEVTRNGEEWTNRFDTEEQALEHLKECEEEHAGNFELKGMTQKDIDKYLDKFDNA